MPEKITYYAIVDDNCTVDNPHGLARRLETDQWFTDEVLHSDFSWAFTPVIVEWERGDFADELAEVSHEQASRIVEYFRARWGEGS